MCIRDRCKAVHYIRQGVVKLVLVSKRGRSGVLGFLAVSYTHLDVYKRQGYETAIHSDGDFFG